MSANEIVLGNKQVARDGEPLVIAEVGVNHDGDTRTAEQLVDAAAAAGAGAVKFQLFDADMLLSKEARLVEYQKSSMAKGGEGGGGAEDLLRPLQLSAAQLRPLVTRAKALGMTALITPFSPPLVAVAAECGADAIKLASPDLVNRPLIEEALRAKLPLVLSTGAATMQEVEQTMEWLGNAARRTVWLHCVSSYPTAPENAALGGITALRTAWPDMAVGYSDHTARTITAALAVCAGACVLEKHLTLDRKRQGPDHAASLEPQDFAEYVKMARLGYAMRGPMDKQVQRVELEVREQTRQSVAAARDLTAGTVLAAADLTVKRPGTGIPAAGLTDLVGRTLAHGVPAGALVRWADLAEPRH